MGIGLAFISMLNATCATAVPCVCVHVALTLGFLGFLARVELSADILQPPLQLTLLLQGQFLSGLAGAPFLHCYTDRKTG